MKKLLEAINRQPLNPTFEVTGDNFETLNLLHKLIMDGERMLDGLHDQAVLNHGVCPSQFRYFYIPFLIATQNIIVTDEGVVILRTQKVRITVENRNVCH